MVARREHRLQLFQTLEFPKSIAEKYLSDKIGPVTEEVSGLLQQIPLTFAELGKFITLWNSGKEAAKSYVRLTQKQLKNDIAKSCSHPNALNLYKTILDQGYLTYDDIIPLIPLQEFEKVFVCSVIVCHCACQQPLNSGHGMCRLSVH